MNKKDILIYILATISLVCFFISLYIFLSYLSSRQLYAVGALILGILCSEFVYLIVKNYEDN